MGTLADKIYKGISCDLGRESFSFEANTKTDEFTISNIRGEKDADWLAILNPWDIVSSSEYKILARTSFKPTMEKAGVRDSKILLGSSLVKIDWEVDIKAKKVWVFMRVDKRYFTNKSIRFYFMILISMIYLK